LEGVLFVLTEGCSWRAIHRPKASWNSVYQYYRRWCKAGLWQELLAQLGHEAAGTLRFLDSTHVKVHCDGANPAGGQEGQAMGRTKGGLNTKIHAVVDNKARPAAVLLSAGNEADITVAPEVIEDVTGPVWWRIKRMTVTTFARSSSQRVSRRVSRHERTALNPSLTQSTPIRRDTALKTSSRR